MPEAMAEEEDGRFELVGAGVVGRRAPLVAAVGVASAAVLLTCMLTSLGYAALGMDLAGCLAAGSGWAATGLAFVGLTAVTAQVASTARGCAGLTMGALGVLFLVRAVADAGTNAPGWLGWLSPVGWTSRADAFGSDRTWVVLLGVAALAAGVAIAVVLLERRDLGAGLLPARRGRGRAGRTLTGPVGLSWRLGRASVIGWTTGMFVGGLVVGSLAEGAMDMFDDPAIADLLRTMGGGAGLLSDVYLTTELGFIAVVATAYGIIAVLRWRSEETAGHTEQVLVTATSRTRYAAGHLFVVVLGTTVLLTALGVGTALADASGGGSLGGLGRVLPAALVRLPAVWVCVGVAVAALGWLPRWTAAIGWGVLAFSVLVGEFGGVFGLPQWLMNLAPFTHVPRMPVEAFGWAPTGGLLAAAAALTGLGLVGWRRRDIG